MLVRIFSFHIVLLLFLGSISNLNAAWWFKGKFIVGCDGFFLASQRTQVASKLREPFSRNPFKRSRQLRQVAKQYTKRNLLQLLKRVPTSVRVLKKRMLKIIQEYEERIEQAEVLGNKYRLERAKSDLRGFITTQVDWLERLLAQNDDALIYRAVQKRIQDLE